MGKFSILILCAGYCGSPTCGSTVRTVDVDRAVMVPLHDPPAAAITPTDRAAMHASISATPMGIGGGTLSGGDPNTGVEVPAVQGSVGALVRFDSGILLGGEAHAALSSLAVKAYPGQRSMGNGLTLGTRMRVGGDWRLHDRIGLVCSIEPGFDVLALSDSLNGDTVDTTLALGSSITPTYQLGNARLFAGVTGAVLPRMTRSIQVTCVDASCQDTGLTGKDYGLAIGGTAGVRYQLQSGTAVALSGTLTREDTGWVPVLGVTISFDPKVRRYEDEEPPSPEAPDAQPAAPPEPEGPYSEDARKRAQGPYLKVPPRLPEPSGPPPPPYVPPEK